MPTYQYRCADCGRELEVVQKFTDASLTECPTCTGDLRKVFNAVGVVFKGSGFYATDNRTKGKSAAAEPAAAGATAGASGKESGGKESGGAKSAGKGATARKESPAA